VLAAALDLLADPGPAVSPVVTATGGPRSRQPARQVVR